MSVNGQDYEFYKKSTISGVKWAGMAEFFIRIFQFAVTIGLARLLTPEDFGLITLALILVKFVQLFIDLGLASTLIQKMEINEQHFHFSFTFLFFASLLIWVPLFLKPEVFAILLGNSDISPLLKALSFMIPLSAVNVLPRVILNRNLKFKELSVADLFSSFGYGIVTIIFAIWLQNVWCFIYGVFAEQILLGIFLWGYAGWKPRFNFSIMVVKDLFNFTGSVFGTRLFNFLNLNLLNVLINKFFGSVALGFFALAYQVIDLPTQRIAKNIMKVMYPVLSKLQKKPVEYEIMLLKSMFVLLLTVLPFFALLFLLAKPFVLIFYGEKWLAVIPFIKILCAVGFIRSLWTGISVICLSSGRPQFELRLNFLMTLFLFPVIIFLAQFGMTAVLLAFAIIYALIYFYGQVAVFKWMRISLNAVADQFKVPLISTGILFLIIQLTLSLKIVNFDHQVLLKFIIISLLSGGIYLIGLFILDKKNLFNLIKLVFTNK